MRLIEVLRIFKPGMSIYRGSSSTNAIPVILNHKGLHAFLAGMPDADFTATDWVVRDDGAGYGLIGIPAAYQCRSSVLHIEATEKLPFSSEHLLTVLRRELDIPDRRDVIVRELWLAMQLLATPENCADFMRRSLVIG